MDWVMSSPNSYVEALTPNVMVFGAGAFGRSLGLDGVMRVGTSWWDWCPYKSRGEIFLSLCHSCSLSQPCEDTVRKQSSASQGESSYLNLAILAPWSQTSSFQNCEKINVCCLSYSVYGILLWQPELTNTSTFAPPTSSGSSPFSFIQEIRLDTRS